MHVVNEKRALRNWKKNNDIKLKQTYITELLHVNQHTWTMIMKLKKHSKYNSFDFQLWKQMFKIKKTFLDVYKYKKTPSLLKYHNAFMF